MRCVTGPVKTPISTADYLRQGDEGAELIFGFQRRRKTSRFENAVVQRLRVILGSEPREETTVAPPASMVILDAEGALVVRPGLAIVTTDRVRISDRRIWGTPDVVVEVVCARTARIVKSSRLHWYRTYGVKECWLVDVRFRRVEVYEFLTRAFTVPRIFPDWLQSREWPRLHVPVPELFDNCGHEQTEPISSHHV